MELILTSIKDYCKRHQITDGGARKRVKQKLVESIILNDITYIVEESREIEQLKTKLKLSQSKIRELRKEAQLYINQKDLILEQKARIEKLEDKLDEQRDSKEKLYENFYAHMTQLSHKT